MSGWRHLEACPRGAAGFVESLKIKFPEEGGRFLPASFFLSQKG